MIVHVTVQLAPGEVLEQSAEEIGHGVLGVLGHDESSAACLVNVLQATPGPVHVGRQFDATGLLEPPPESGRG
jgi:hypothetical protein